MTDGDGNQQARRPRRRPMTLAALAAELGVSRTTVSNAYNRPSQLSPALRERILSAARQLGYAGPDPVARSLRMRHAGAIGLLLTEQLSYAFGDPAAVATLQGIATACESAGTGLLLVPAGEGGSVQTALATRAPVDGFIAYSLPRGDTQLAAALARPVPTVVIDGPLGIPAASWVGIDDAAAARKLGEHLHSLGHRQIGILATKMTEKPSEGLLDFADVQASTYDVQRQRLEGITAGLGVPLSRVPVVECHEQSVRAASIVCRRFLESSPELTALACTTDVLAMGALQAARDLGLSVPADLSITGFDDVVESARWQLTTVQQPHRGKGEVAWELLDAMMKGQSPSRRILPTELVVRGTTAPLY